MSAEHAHRFSGLHQQCLVVFERAQATHDGVERGPVPRGTPGAAVDEQLVRLFRNLGMETIHEHPERGLLMPAFAGDFAAPRRADNGRRLAHLLSVSYALAVFPGDDALGRSTNSP